MSKDRNLTITIDGDSKQLTKEFDKIRKQTKGLQDGLSTIAKTSAVAFAGLTAGIVGVTAAFRDDEQAQIRTVQTLKATGNAAGLTAQEIFKMAEAFQDATTFADATVLEGQNLLLTFKSIGGEVFPRATQAMLDMSVAMKQGVKESSIQLGKALNDPIAGISALTRVGIQFTEEQKNMIRTLQESGNVAGAQAVILKELESQFGGVANAAAQGTGKLIQLREVVSNIMSQIGEATFGILEPFVDKLLEIARSIRDSDSAFASITAKILTYGSAAFAVTGVLAGLGLAIIGVKNALLLARVAVVAFGTAAASAWAKATLGLSLIVTGTITLVEQMGGLSVVIDKIEAGVTKLALNSAIAFNNMTIGFNKFKMLFASNTGELLEANNKLIEKNKELGMSYNEIFENISAERAAEKIKGVAEAERVARDEAAKLEADRKSTEEARKRQAENEQRTLIAEQKAAAFEANIAIQQLEAELQQAVTDKASNVERTKLQQKIKALAKIRDKSISDEQKAKFKNQDELRKAAEKDAAETLEFKKKFAEDTLDSAVSLGKNLVKEGSAAQKALFLVEKAGALASAVVNTARAVTTALASAPPPLSYILAAAAGAAGAIQVAAITSTAIGLENGGMVGRSSGARPGDRHPAMLADGELVVPRKNFEEVVMATARAKGMNFGGDNQGTGTSKIEISFTDDAAEIITAKQLENSTLGTDRG